MFIFFKIFFFFISLFFLSCNCFIPKNDGKNLSLDPQRVTLELSKQVQQQKEKLPSFLKGISVSQEALLFQKNLVSSHPDTLAIGMHDCNRDGWPEIVHIRLEKANIFYMLGSAVWCRYIPAYLHIKVFFNNYGHYSIENYQSELRKLFIPFPFSSQPAGEIIIADVTHDQRLDAIILKEKEILIYDDPIARICKYSPDAVSNLLKDWYIQIIPKILPEQPDLIIERK